ncbi:hypothetical protein [Bartonella sp. CB178]
MVVALGVAASAMLRVLFLQADRQAWFKNGYTEERSLVTIAGNNFEILE